MSDTQKYIIISLLLLLIAAPFTVFAGLVPCGRSADAGATAEEQEPCSICHLYVLAQKIINFLMWTATPALAALGFAIGGFKILISGPQPGLRQAGIKTIKDTVYGLLIVFGAWIIINQLLLTFAGGAGTGKVPFLSSPWNTISCPGVSSVPPISGPAYDENGTERIGLAAAGILAQNNYCQNFGPPEQTTNCTTLAQLPGNAIAGLVALRSNCNCTIFITGGTEIIGHTTHGPGIAVVDLRRNTLLDAYIMGLTSLGNQQYTGPNGTTYLLESNPSHWHVRF